MTVHRGEESEKRGVHSEMEIGGLHVSRGGTKQPLGKVIAAIEKDLDDIHQQLDRIEELIRRATEDNAA